MLSRAVFDAMCNDFDNEFGELSEHDEYLQRMTQEALGVISDKGCAEDASDAIINLTTAASRLGFLIGIRTGTGMINTLSSVQLPQQILEFTGDWCP